jgi:FlaA1/EpsC-like NDP-sugar epimerase
MAQPAHPSGIGAMTRQRQLSPWLMLRNLLLRFRRPIVVGLHLLIIPLGYWLAFAIRFDFDVPPSHTELYWRTMPVILVLRLAAFGYFGLFQGWWRHAGMRDLGDLIRAACASSLMFLVALFGLRMLNTMPRSVIPVDWILTVMIFGGGRFAVRGFRERRLLPRVASSAPRTLVIGAGNAAERLLRECVRDPKCGFNPVALVDDDVTKHGMRLHGVPVLGTVAALPELVTRLQAEIVVIAIPSAGRAEMRRVLEACISTGVEFKIVPSLRELLEGRARVNELRKVQIEDLLGRDSVDLGTESLADGIYGRTVLVTGGAGSIGSELARQLAMLGPRRLLLLDQAESPLYFVHLELLDRHPDLEIVPLVADVTEQGAIDAVFARYRPDLVFHAAAYKHVPMMERNAVQAVRNNVLGTLITAQAAATWNTGRFVLISTDKAVYPSSVMGATKRLAEQIVLGWPALRSSNTDFRAVRFGNVLGSEGSVIPLFRKQLEQGKPLTVTHPDVTRYFMTIPEATQLVLHAAALPEAAGRICMLDMGEPVRITELAENLIRLSGLEPYRDVPIVFTGLRPGEKLHEDLMSSREQTVPTSLPKIRIVQTDEPNTEELIQGLDQLAVAASVESADDCLNAIRQLVPECVPPLGSRSPAGGGATIAPA